MLNIWGVIWNIGRCFPTFVAHNRDHSGYGLSQWETTLQCYAVEQRTKLLVFLDVLMLMWCNFNAEHMRSNLKYWKVLPYICGPQQGSFWVWAQPMRDDITMLCGLSLSVPIPRLTPAQWDSTTVFTWSKSARSLFSFVCILLEDKWVLGSPGFKSWWHQLRSGPGFNIKMTFYQYRKSHCGDKTILRQCDFLYW